MADTRRNVFISNTSIDQPEYRAAVCDAILPLGLPTTPASMVCLQ